MDVLYGLHPVEEAIRAGVRQIDHVSVAREREARRDPRMEALLELCRAASVRVSTESRDQLTRHVRTDAHQGVVAFLKERRLLALEDLLERPAGGSGSWFFSRSTAWKTRITWVRCCAPPMARALTASCCRSAGLHR